MTARTLAEVLAERDDYRRMWKQQLELTEALLDHREQVLALHQPRVNDHRNGWTGEPFTDCTACCGPWPCRTIRALVGEVES